jgi:hypothetical protein
VGGFRSSDAETPWKVPFSSPRNHPALRFSPTSVGPSGPGRGDLGMPPSVAGPTLTMRLAHTTEKRPSHRPQGAFSGGCCTNSTQLSGSGIDRMRGQKSDLGKTKYSMHYQHTVPKPSNAAECRSSACAGPLGGASKGPGLAERPHPDAVGLTLIMTVSNRARLRGAIPAARPRFFDPFQGQNRRTQAVTEWLGGEDGIRTHDTGFPV